MKALIFDGVEARVEDRPLPVPKADECLVRVLISGICNTDLELVKGYMGFRGVLGHEFVGCVESAPAANQDLIGKRVVGEINLACTCCTVCSAGGDRARNHCPKRTVLGILAKDGCHAEYVTLPVRNLHIVPDEISTRNAAFAEPLAAAFRILEQGLVRPAIDSVAIIGDGKLGLLIAYVLANSCAQEQGSIVTLIGRHREKMNLIPHPNLNCVLAQDMSIDDTTKFDVVVDATGNAAGLDLARSLCRPLGTLVLKSTCAVGSEFNTAPFVIDELKLVGSRCGPFEPALQLLANGILQDQNPLDLSPLISEVFSIQDATIALQKAGEKGILKVQLNISSS
mmetsp:Transcript_12593/g.18879  ORF Transcript_12593/g.18879 Transcript_12593/m.18879 type:complete len:340 (-) Transcript_12593:337-1356(-)